MIREFNVDTDYNEVASWWKKQEWPVLPPQFLSIKGYMSIQDDNKAAACWIYMDPNSPVCVVEWYVGNPDISWELRRDGISEAMDACFSYAKSMGKTHVFSMAKNNRLIEKMLDKGFVKTDENMTHLLRSL